MKISVIIPAHNEEASIAATVTGVMNAVRTPKEIIVVLDHCTDRTEEIVRELQKTIPVLRIMINADRKGSFGNAVIRGFREATGDAIVPVMADLCDDPTTIDRMYATLTEKTMDVVCASRYMKGGKKSGGPRLQNILSRLTCYSLKILTRIPTWDAANSYKMYRTDFLRSLRYDIPDAGTEYSLALLFRAYFAKGRITEIPTEWRGEKILLGDEFKILRRFPGYWFWYRRALEKKA